MKVFKIACALIFIIVSSASCDKNGDRYPDKDGNNVSDSDDLIDNDPDLDLSDIDNPVIDSDIVTEEDVDTDIDIESDFDSSSDGDETDDESDENPDVDDVYVPICGNGISEIGEECDKGVLNSDEPGEIGITCRTDCT
ncbi:MAG TPA: hypothetical protein PL056_13525, partial [bacterium]|nr:hypothetical protein [bacterium]